MANNISNFFNRAYNTATEYAAVAVDAASRFAADVGPDFKKTVSGALGYSPETKPYLSAPEVVAALDGAAIQKRLNAPKVNDNQIKVEINRFSTNIAYISTMKVIDHFICGMVEDEETYFNIIAGCKSASDYRRAYFAYLDQAGLFFLVRWVAKIAFFFMYPAIDGQLQSSAQEFFNDFNGQIREKTSKEFDARFREEIINNNRETERWIEALEAVSQDEGINQAAMLVKLEEEINLPKYHDGMDPTKFYEMMSSKLADKYFPKLQISQKVFNAFQIHGKAAWWKSALNVLFFPVAALLYLTFLIPQYTINKMIGWKVKRFLKEEKLLENIFQRSMGALTDSAGLSGPVLKVVNEKLEETLFEMNLGKADIADALREKLQPTSLELLEENVRLSTKARKIFYRRPQEEQAWLDRLTQEGVAKGLENIVLLVMTKATDADYVKQGAFKVLQSVNRAFKKGPQTEEERKLELEKQQKRFNQLVKTIIALSIKQKVPQHLPYVPSMGQDVLGRLIFDTVSKKVEESIGMTAHPFYIKFVVREMLMETIKRL